MTRMMMATSLFLISSVALVAADPAAGVKDIQGEYTIKAMYRGGQAAPAEVVSTFKGVTIKDNSMTLQLQDEKKVATIRVDASKTPHSFDLMPNDGPEKGKTMPGIYKLDGKELTIMFSPAEDSRPAGFDAVGETVMKIVLTKK